MSENPTTGYSSYKVMRTNAQVLAADLRNFSQKADQFLSTRVLRVLTEMAQELEYLANE